MRAVQHVAVKADVEKAKRKGKKITALCGARIYPMTEMDESVPTCTPCHRLEREELRAQIRSPWVAMWTWVA